MTGLLRLVPLVQALLTKGADKDSRRQSDKETALHAACLPGHTAIVQQLCEAFTGPIASL